MKIERMEIGKEFRIKCVEHNAVFTCSNHELHVAGKRTFSYECPVCGTSHLVPAYRIEEITVYKHDIDLKDPHLPVNVIRAAEKAAKKTQKTFRQMKRFYKAAMSAVKETESENTAAQEIPNESDVEEFKDSTLANTNENKTASAE